MAHNEPLEAVQPPPRPCTVACDAPQTVEGMPIAPVKSPPQHTLRADSTRGTLSTHSVVVRAARRHHPSVGFCSCLGVRRSPEATRIFGATGVRPDGGGSESRGAPHSPQPGSPATDPMSASNEPRICKHLAALLMWAVYGCTPPARARSHAPQLHNNSFGFVALEGPL